MACVAVEVWMDSCTCGMESVAHQSSNHLWRTCHISTTMKSCMFPFKIFRIFQSFCKSSKKYWNRGHVNSLGFNQTGNTLMSSMCLPLPVYLRKLFRRIFKVLDIHVMLMMMLLSYSTIAFRNPPVHRHIAKPPLGIELPKKVCKFVIYLHRSQGQLNL